MLSTGAVAIFMAGLRIAVWIESVIGPDEKMAAGRHGAVEAERILNARLPLEKMIDKHRR